MSLIEKEALLAEYDKAHVGPPGGARKLIEEAPSVEAIPVQWIEKHLEWLDNCDNDFTQLAKVGIRAMVEIWKNPYKAYIPNWCINTIRDLPSAQPERKTGKWIEHNPHKFGLGIVFECSECGEEIECEEYNYCPNCGADMREEKK